MAYEYESDIPKFLKGIESEHPLDLSKEINELQEVYRKAKAYDLLKEDIEVNEKVFREQAENDEISDIIHGHYLALLEQS